jgi:hypothetical protein
MKKVFLLAVVLVASLAANAQRAIGGLTLKPMVGMTIATITGGNADSKIGLAAGAEAEYVLAKQFSLTGGLIYSMQGCKGSSSGISSTTSLDYLNIPILANYYIIPGLAAKVGLQPAFNLRAKGKLEYQGKTEESDINGVKSLDFSIPFGLSYEISDFVIDARYQLGLTDIMSGSSSKNSVFMISVGYKFDLLP